MHLAIEEGLESAERSGSSATWVMSNHDVPRHVSRYGLPQVPAASHHQLAKDWLLRDGTTYEENRELGAKRARAAILMELALPGSTYIYQAKNWDCRKSLIFLGMSWKILPRSTAYTSKPKRAVTAAVCRCPGSPQTHRSSMIPMTNSATMVLSVSLLRAPSMIHTYHSRNGTRISPSTWRMPTRIPC